MRVVYLTRGFGDYLIGLVNGTSEFLDTHVVLAKNDEWMEGLFSNRVTVFKSGAPRITSIGNLPAMLRTALYIHRVKPDLIHAQSGVIWELGLLRLHHRIPAVVTVHDITKHPMRGVLRFFPQNLLDYAAHVAAGIIVHGSTMREHARSRYGNGHLIASIDHGIISRYGIGKATYCPGGANVLAFGTIDQWKGIEYLVACEPAVRRALPNAEFVVAGYSPDPSYYTSLRKPGQKIDFRLRKQDQEEVRQLFEWADVLVLPYIEASQSGVLQLGFSFAVPSVVTSVGGLPDVVEHERNGLVVPPKDPEALADAIVRMLTDVKLRASVIENMIKDREERFDWRNIASKTVRLYHEVLAGKTLDRVQSNAPGFPDV